MSKSIGDVNTKLEAMAADPDMAKVIAQWKKDGKSATDLLLAQSTLALEPKSSAFTHPDFWRLRGYNSRDVRLAMSGSAPANFRASDRSRDEINFAGRGDAAGAVKNAVSGAIRTFGRGIEVIGSLFRESR